MINEQDLDLPVRYDDGVVLRIEDGVEGEINAIVQLNDGNRFYIPVLVPKQNFCIRNISMLQEIARELNSVSPPHPKGNGKIATLERILLQTTEPLCRCVLQEKSLSEQIAKPIQGLRRRNDIILATILRLCPFCRTRKQHHIAYHIRSTQQQQWNPVTQKQRRKILSIIGDRDPFTERVLDQPQVDHRCPTIRTRNATPNVDALSDDEIMNTFQVLSRGDNRRKGFACDRCISTGFRGCPVGEREEEVFTSGNERWNRSTELRGI